MTQVDKIKKLGKVMGKYFTNVKVGYDIWEDGGLGIYINVGKSKVEIIPSEDTDYVSVMFIENGKMYPCDEVVPVNEYEFFGEFMSKSLATQK